jgi:hypothetical protein
MSRPSANGQAPPRPADWAAASYQPASGTPLRHCGAHGCGAAYLDDDPGRQAHIAVFAHSPRPRQATSSPQENP